MRSVRSLAAAVLVLLTALMAGCAADAATPPVTTAIAEAAPTGTSGLPTVFLPDLPREAQQTYDLILDGGPYSYPQDGRVFGNREGTLPHADHGWYREYTVETPASSDRGARRFVVSEDGIFFYTDDHYSSFREVLR